MSRFTGGRIAIALGFLLGMCGCQRVEPSAPPLIVSYDWKEWAAAADPTHVPVGPSIEGALFTAVAGSGEHTASVGFEVIFVENKEYRVGVIFKDAARLAEVASYGDAGQMEFRVSCVVPTRIVIYNCAAVQLGPEELAGTAGVILKQTGANATIELKPGIYDFRLVDSARSNSLSEN